MKYLEVIFGGKVLKYEIHYIYFQFLIYKKIIESRLEDLNCTCVTKAVQEQEQEGIINIIKHLGLTFDSHTFLKV